MTDSFSSPRHDPEPEPVEAVAPDQRSDDPPRTEPKANRATRARSPRARTRAAEPPEAAPPPLQSAAAPPAAARAPEPAAPRAEAAAEPSAPPAVPRDFVTDAEHPILPIPFKAQIGEERLEGVALSVTAAYVAIDGALDARWLNHRDVLRLQFDFQGFSLSLSAEAIVAGSRRPGEMTLQFLDPLGPHLPQLRHVINSFIAGDLVTLGGLLNYTGPTKPKAEAPAEGPTPLRLRVRSFGVAALSAALILTAGYVLLDRATTSYELHPVFVDRAGRDMRATTAGQVAYLNPEAKTGEVVFSVNSNTGDVLNFQLPCDCEVVVTEGVYQGATVLPTDVILSFFEANVGIRVQTLVSIEGLSKIMSGNRAFLDFDDGRTIAARVEVTSATTAAALRGDLYVPVELVPQAGEIGPEDIGASARLRLATPWMPGLPFVSGEDS